MLRWFGHEMRLSEIRLTKGICKVDVSHNARKGRPRRTYVDLIDEVLQKGQVCSLHYVRVLLDV